MPNLAYDPPMTKTGIVKGSGNIFRDLGFGEKKSVELIL
jgi:hypothetical protein